MLALHTVNTSSIPSLPHGSEASGKEFLNAAPDVTPSIITRCGLKTTSIFKNYGVENSFNLCDITEMTIFKTEE